MTNIFVSGSMKIKHLDRKVIERLAKIVDADHNVIVGDADGVDSSVQRYLEARGFRSVIVYCTGTQPRNNLGQWDTEYVASTSKPGTREYYTKKDKQMAEDCDCGLMVWDARSTGTLSNAIELVKRGKAALVYINKAKQFLKVKGVQDVEVLISYMSETSLEKADRKIGLFNALNSMKFSQRDIFDVQQSTYPDRT